MQQEVNRILIERSGAPPQIRSYCEVIHLYRYIYQVSLRLEITEIFHFIQFLDSE